MTAWQAAASSALMSAVSAAPSRPPSSRCARRRHAALGSTHAVPPPRSRPARPAGRGRDPEAGERQLPRLGQDDRLHRLRQLSCSPLKCVRQHPRAALVELARRNVANVAGLSRQVNARRARPRRPPAQVDRVRRLVGKNSLTPANSGSVLRQLRRRAPGVPGGGSSVSGRSSPRAAGSAVLPGRYSAARGPARSRPAPRRPARRPASRQADPGALPAGRSPSRSPPPPPRRSGLHTSKLRATPDNSGPGEYGCER